MVNLLKKDVPPPAPKTDWLPLLPNEAPISAPFPDCNKTTAIRNRLTSTCKIVRAIVIPDPLATCLKREFITQRFASCKAQNNNVSEVKQQSSVKSGYCSKRFRFKTRPANECPINICLGHQSFDIIRLHTATVENTDSFGDRRIK